jgi:hypothetical protein
MHYTPLVYVEMYFHAIAMVVLFLWHSRKLFFKKIIISTVRV